MAYIKRNEFGKIIAIASEYMEGFVEVSDVDRDELESAGIDMVLQDGSLAKSDIEFVRVIEDVIELLMAKNLIQFTELPQASQQKMLRRQKKRENFSRSLNLLETSEDFKY
jgi:hypothetical protein